MMKSIITPYIITCDSWILFLRESGFYIGWAFVILLIPYVGYLLKGSSRIFLGLELGNSFDTQEEYLLEFNMLHWVD